MDWHGEGDTQANVQESTQPPRQPPEPIHPSAQSPHTKPPQFASGTDLVSQANLQDSTQPRYKPPAQIDISADIGNVMQENKVPRTADKSSYNLASQSETQADMASFTEEKKVRPTDTTSQEILQNSQINDHLEQNKALIESGLSFLKLIQNESCSANENTETVRCKDAQSHDSKSSDHPNKITTNSGDIDGKDKVTDTINVKKEEHIVKEVTLKKSEDIKPLIHNDASTKPSSKVKERPKVSKTKKGTSKEPDSGSDDFSDSSYSAPSPFSEPLVLKEREVEVPSTSHRHRYNRSASEDSDQSFHRNQKHHERQRYGQHRDRYSEERVYDHESSDSDNSTNAKDKEIRSRTKNKRRRYSSESSSGDSEERHGSMKTSPVKDLREKISSKRKSERKRSHSKDPKKRDKEKTGIKLKLFIKDKQFNCAVSTKTSSETSESNVTKKSKDKKKKKKHKSKHEAERTSTAEQKLVSPIKIRKREEWQVSNSRKRSRSPSSSRSDSGVSPVLPKRAKIKATSSKLPSSKSNQTALSNAPQSNQMSVNGQYHRSIADDPVIRSKAWHLVEKLGEQHVVSIDL